MFTSPELTPEEHDALKIIVKGNWIMQPVFPEHVKERLLKLRLVKQTLGGTLKATDEGTLAADPAGVAAVLFARRKLQAEAAKRAREKTR
jgi:hypothetical protein